MFIDYETIIKTMAKQNFSCPNCGQFVRKGSTAFKHAEFEEEVCSSECVKEFFE